MVDHLKNTSPLIDPFDNDKQTYFSRLKTAYRSALEPTQQNIQWVPEVFTYRVKWPGREAATHLHLVSEVKNECSYTSTPSYVFMAWFLFKKGSVQFMHFVCLNSFNIPENKN
jgi:hypothetical protein